MLGVSKVTQLIIFHFYSYFMDGFPHLGSGFMIGHLLKYSRACFDFLFALPFLVITATSIYYRTDHQFHIDKE